MTALRKFCVFGPQIFGVGLSTANATAAAWVNGSIWTLPFVVIAVVAGFVALITAAMKADAIGDHGWGHFDEALETDCAGCRRLEAANDRLETKLTETRDALATLRLP